MYNKRLIITSTISIVLVSMLLIGSTYSIFTSTSVDEKENVYTTGVLDITYTLSEDNVIMEDATPTSIEDSIEIKPYRITVINNGNVAYKFNVILNDTTASNKISNQYIMTQVGKITPTLLSECTDNILKKDIVVMPNTSVDVDIRVWLYTNVQNSEMGKSFYGKLAIDGLAINTDETEIDNSNLIAELPKKLSSVAVGSYVAYEGTGGKVGSTNVVCKKNGAASSSTDRAETEAPNSCLGQNAREDLETETGKYGYCYNSSYKNNTTGWRIGYIKDGKAMLVSAGSPECISRPQVIANSDYIKKANARAMKYCNSNYVDGNCTCTDSNNDGLCDSPSTDAWALGDTDFYYITKAINGYGKRLTEGSSSLGEPGGSLGSTLYCWQKYSKEECGYNNDLIDNGGFYWFAAQNSSSDTDGVFWYPSSHAVYNYNSFSQEYGSRFVISLRSDVYITGGTGTPSDPYTIANN